MEKAPGQIIASYFLHIVSDSFSTLPRFLLFIVHFQPCAIEYNQFSFHPDTVVWLLLLGDGYVVQGSDISCSLVPGAYEGHHFVVFVVDFILLLCYLVRVPLLLCVGYHVRSRSGGPQEIAACGVFISAVCGTLSPLV